MRNKVLMSANEMISVKEERKYKNLFSNYDSNDLIDRALASEQDIKHRRTTRIEDFKKEIDAWIKCRLSSKAKTYLP
jgi:hypothetical protein